MMNEEGSGSEEKDAACQNKSRPSKGEHISGGKKGDWPEGRETD